MEDNKYLQKSASSLLDKTEILTRLANLGTVNVTGSYAYDLMIEPDIDIEVYCKDPHQAAISFAQGEIASGTWNGVMFYDWHQWRLDNFPEGYYVGFNHYFQERRWKMDVWFLAENSPVRNADKLVSEASPEQRALILEAKMARLTENWPIDSTGIYQAIIKGGLTTLDAVREAAFTSKKESKS
jgi:hypothetical protein